MAVAMTIMVRVRMAMVIIATRMWMAGFRESCGLRWSRYGRC